jgi:hypothetical protein
VKEIRDVGDNSFLIIYEETYDESLIPDKGFTGAPIILTKNENQHYIIGVHIGRYKNEDKTYYGTAMTKQLHTWIRNQCIEQRKKDKK